MGDATHAVDATAGALATLAQIGLAIEPLHLRYTSDTLAQIGLAIEPLHLRYTSVTHPIRSLKSASLQTKRHRARGTPELTTRLELGRRGMQRDQQPRHLLPDARQRRVGLREKARGRARGRWAWEVGVGGGRGRWMRTEYVTDV